MAASSAATQKLPNILWNPKVHYRVHRSPPPVTILSQTNPIHTTPTYLRSILLLFSHLRLGLPSDIFLSGSSTKDPICIPFTCMLHALPFSCSLITFQLYMSKSRCYESSHYAVFLQPLVTSSILGTNTLPSVPCSQTPSICSPPSMSETNFHTYTEPRAEL
jgi:hypothetical protein